MREIKDSGNISSRFVMFYNFTMSLKNHKPVEQSFIQCTLFYVLLNDNKVIHPSNKKKKKDLPLSNAYKKKDNLGGVFGFQDIISAGMHAGDVGVHV